VCPADCQQPLEGEVTNLGLEGFIRSYYAGVAIDSIRIQQQALPAGSETKRLNIVIYTTRPGAVIGRRGRAVKRLQQLLATQAGCPVKISVHEPKPSAGGSL